MGSPERISFEISVEEDETTTTAPICSLKACNFCNRTLLHGKDVYMYRDGTYCSIECRLDRINLYERTEKAKSRKINKKLDTLDANPLDEAAVAWIDKLHSRKRFKRFNKENVKSLEDEARVGLGLAGLGFVMGAADSSISKARQRKISSTAQVNRAKKYSNQRALHEKRKLKSSSEHLLLQDLNNPYGIREASSTDLFLQGRDHVITINYKIDQGKESCKTDSVEWTILLVTLALEASSAVFDQVSSPSKPFYALIGVIMSLLALAICVGEIAYKAKRERVTWRRKGRICWLYYPFPRDLPFGSFIDCFGLACAIVQCIFSVVEYAFFIRHANNPIKLCIVPVIFASCLVFSRLIKNHGTMRVHE